MNVVQYHLLGPVGLWAGGHRIGPDTRQLRCVLALLLLNVEQVVAIPALTDALWPSARPFRSVGAGRGQALKVL